MKRKWLYYGIMALSLAVMPLRSKALAADTNWTGGGGDTNWDNGANWDNGVPLTGDRAFLNQPGFTVDYVNASNPTLGTVEVDDASWSGISLNQAQDILTTDSMTVGNLGYGAYNLSGAGSLVVNNNLTVGVSTGSSGWVAQDGGDVTVSGNTIVGDYGTGVFDQSGGTHNVTGDLTLGNQSTGNGTYNLSDTGSVAVSGDTIVGNYGTGVFNQSGGTNSTTGLFLANQWGSAGTYNLSGGDLTTSWAVVGQWGVGVFNQTGGTHTTSDLLLGSGGSSTNSDGTYNLSGGVLTALGETVGAFGKGTFNQTGGTNTTGYLTVADGPEAYGGTPTRGGDYNLSAGDLSVAGSTIVGNGNSYFIGEPGGKGTFTQTGGTHTTGTLILGGAGSIGNGNGTYNLSGGDLTSSSTVVGEGGTGIFDQSGGTHNVTGDLVVGQNAGSSGTYNLYSGDLGNISSWSSSEYIGQNGVGVFNQSGGTNTVGYNFVLGQNYGGDGFYNLSGGILYTSFIGGGSTIIGENGAGVFNQSGGTNTAVIWTTLGQNVGGYGEYNLSGGTLYSGLTVGGAGTGTFNQDGGTYNVNGNLLLGYQSTGDGTYNLMSGGILSNPYSTIIGMDGDGTFNQSGGTHDANNLRVGQRYGTGTYNLSGGDLNVTVQTVVGGKLNSAATGTFNMTGGTLTTAGETVIGYYGTGTFNQSAGTHTTGSMVIGKEAGGLGTYNLSGGTNTVSGTLTIAQNTGSTGTYNYSGGTLTAGSIVNNGAFNQSGGTTVNANVTNNASYNMSGAVDNTVVGNFTNSATGTVKTTGTTAVFTGVFTNNGVFASDPSNNYFSDLIVGSTGYLTGGTGDSFFISNDFMNNSTQNVLWDTTAAYLSFTTGADSDHNFSLAGADLGAVMGGFTNNFAWGTLDITGNTLNLSDGNAAPGGALYADILLGASISGGTITNIFANGMNVYYDASLSQNAYLGGGTYSFTGGGQLIAIGGGQTSVPEPSTLLLLAAGFGGLLAARKRLFKRKA